jgi:RNA polymerase sigma-70 factor, ECF subfamily
MIAMDEDMIAIRRTLEGDANAFEVLLRKYTPAIFPLVGRKIPATDVAGVVQDVFVSAFRSLRTYESKQPFDHWLARIARRRCCDYWRERERLNSREGGSLDDPGRQWLDNVGTMLSREALNEAGARADAAEVVQRLLGELDAEDRALMEGIYFEDVSFKEMAAALGWTVVKAKVRAHRARNKLRATLGKMCGKEVKS